MDILNSELKYSSNGTSCLVQFGLSSDFFFSSNYLQIGQHVVQLHIQKSSNISLETLHKDIRGEESQSDLFLYFRHHSSD